MAERRMFAKTIVLSDAFLDMPLSARCLYFTLGMLADDDGFVNSPKSIMRQAGASNDDLNLLMVKRFILKFDSGVIVIKHWRIHNYIQKDRYKGSKYIEEKASLMIDPNGAYTECIQDVSILDTQVRLGKDRLELGKDSIEGDGSEASPPKPTKHKYGSYSNVLLTDEEYHKLVEEFPADYQTRIERLSEYIASTGKKYKCHLATIRSWSRNERSTPAVKNKVPMGSTGQLGQAELDNIRRLMEES
jgi:hypothetical protein